MNFTHIPARTLKSLLENRLELIGVPAYSILKDGVLLGSVSPWIRRKYFPKEALCLSLELQKGSIESKKFTARMLEILKEIQSRDEFIEFMKKNFLHRLKRQLRITGSFTGKFELALKILKQR